MSRLFVVVGYADNTPSAVPFAVYVGNDGDAKRQAMAASAAARFLILDHPTGIRKNNPHAAANAARMTVLPESTAELPAPAAEGTDAAPPAPAKPAKGKR